MNIIFERRIDQLISINDLEGQISSFMEMFRQNGAIGISDCVLSITAIDPAGVEIPIIGEDGGVVNELTVHQGEPTRPKLHVAK